MSKKKELDVELVKEKDKRKNANKIGQKFEDRLQKVFDELRGEGICYISKIPTEFTILRRGAKIVSAFPKAQSRFLDYVGIINGKFITIEAKTCGSSKTSYPLSGFKEYQLPLLKEFLDYGAMGYVAIQMRELNKTFLIEGYKFLETVNGLNRKSIPIELLEEIGIEVGKDLQGLKTFIKVLASGNK